MNFDFITCVDYQKLNDFIYRNYYREDVCLDIVVNLIKNNQAPSIYKDVLPLHPQLVNQIPEYVFQQAIMSAYMGQDKENIVYFYFKYKMYGSIFALEILLDTLPVYDREMIVSNFLFRDDIPPLSENFWLKYIDDNILVENYLRHCKYMYLYEDLFWEMFHSICPKYHNREYMLSGDFKNIPEDFKIRIRLMQELTED